MTLSKPSLHVLQVLPALNSGGVERGTVEFANELVLRGHRSTVMSNGGQLVKELENNGSTHLLVPVHKKSLTSLLQVRRVRHILNELKPDVIHVRSRAPAWIIWLAWRKLPKENRPRLVSTFHGMYSVNKYSAIMAKAEHCIAISNCVQDYMLTNYEIPPSKITRIYRGLDPKSFNSNACNPQWRASLLQEYPELENKKIILMPGRLSRWKGQEAFIKMMHLLIQIRPDCHGVIVGSAEPQKEHYQSELLSLTSSLGLENNISFMGHRSDIQAFYGFADVTCHMSNKAEPFGRTVPEALACGCPVVAFDRGGASESLNAGFPKGLVEPDNIQAFAQRIAELLDTHPEFYLPKEFYLNQQVDNTLGVYEKLLSNDEQAN
ncbi:glycosyltransferase family 4 protein [Neptunomonas phycophila]|uniref:glycosyltransferase family 4 protein n=1 Tax=Neptunomonas phycophila TaxID=1572645 RepID=UPI0030F5FD30